MNIAICDDDRKICRFLEEKIRAVYQNAFIKSFCDANTLWNAAKQEPKHAPENTNTCEQRIAVKSGGMHTSVKISDIIYAEVFNRKVVLHTATENIEYYGKLKNLEDELSGDFYRPHRSYLVNLKYVTKYDSSAIFLQGGQVMMAKQNYAGFVKAYMAYMKRTCNE